MGASCEFIMENGVLTGYSGPGGNVAIPEGVREIGPKAFFRCADIESVIIPEGVTSIGESAFFGCKRLKAVSIPESAESIGRDAFTGTAYINASSLRKDGVVYDGAVLLRAKSTVSGHCSVNPGTRLIADEAFSGCRLLTGVTIPDSVVRIGRGAFSYCSGLESADIPRGVKEIERGVFSSCTVLRRVTIPEGVMCIGDRAFERCRELAGISIPDTVTSIGACAFYNCGKLNSVSIPDGVTCIGKYAFSGCDALTEIRIPEGITEIGFCTLAFSGLKKVTLPDSLTAIGESAFSGCRSLTDIAIPDSVTSIGRGAFSYCFGLKSVTIPDSVTSFGEDIFCGSECDVSLRQIPAGFHAVMHGWEGVRLFTGDMLTRVPVRLRQQALAAFAGEKGTDFASPRAASYLEYARKNAGKLVRAAFDRPELLYLMYEHRLIPAKELDIYLAEADRRDATEYKALLLNYQHRLGSAAVTKARERKEKTRETYSDAQAERAAARSTAEGIEGLTFVVSGKLPEYWGSKQEARDYLASYGAKLDDAVTKRTDYLVADVRTGGSDKKRRAEELGVQIITVEEFSLMTGRRYKNAPQVTIPPWIRSIPRSAFRNCSLLTEITIPEGVTSIADHAFYRCTGLKSVTIPESVKSIGVDAFKGTAIWSDAANRDQGALFIGSALIDWSKPVFREKVPLYPKKSASVIAGGAFCGNIYLKRMRLPQGMTAISACTFANCVTLESVTIPDSVRRIGYRAFAACRSLAGLKLPEGVTEIGDEAFRSCEQLADFSIPRAVKSIGAGAFMSCESLAEITIPEGVTKIGRYTFYGCSGLTCVTIPKSVTAIGRSAFSLCSKVTIRAPAGSYAEKYAMEHGIPFTADGSYHT